MKMRWMAEMHRAGCSGLPRLTAYGLLALLSGTAVSFAESALSVETISNPSGVRISLAPNSPAGWGLIQLVEKSGKTLKTVHAGRLSSRDHFVVVANEHLPPGTYRLKYREGVELTLDREIERPDANAIAWLNPTDLVLVGPAVYVLDAGQDVQATSPELTAERAAKQPAIFKMDRDGNPDKTFGEDGRLILPDLYGRRSFAVDPTTGKIFIGSGHDVKVFEANGSPSAQTVAGWDNDPNGPKGTVWVDSLTLGFGNRIYIPNPGYSNGKVYDRTKNGFEGILYRFEIQDVNGLGRHLCADGNGSLYYCGMSHQITKYIDDGKSLVASYKSGPEARLASPCGGSASAGLVWWASHGPGFGPYWDSGGGGEVVLFWDTGTELKVIARYGIPGTAAGRMEFMNPSAAIMDEKHDELWVVEDGQPNPDGPKGNARVRRFLLKAGYSEELDFQLTK